MSNTFTASGRSMCQDSSSDNWRGRAGHDLLSMAPARQAIREVNVKTVIFACVHTPGDHRWRRLLQSAGRSARREPFRRHHPAARVHPEVIASCRAWPRSLSKFTTPHGRHAQAAYLLVTMDARRVPHVPWLRRDDWPLADPKSQPPDRVREIRDEIRKRVATLIAREDCGS